MSDHDLHVTTHAIQRYQERVALVSDEKAREALSSPTIKAAAKFGARTVILGTGQRVLLRDNAVITILPTDFKPWRIDA